VRGTVLITGGGGIGGVHILNGKNSHKDSLSPGAD
jgi:hypothetical protein